MLNPLETSFTKVLPLNSNETLKRRFMVLDEPIKANMRFGLLLEVLDKVAEEAALAYVNRFHPEARVVTAAIDNIVVRHVTDISRDIHFKARINYVGRSSLEVGIRVEQPGGGPVQHIASCYFTMVARSGHGEEAVSVTLPGLDYQGELEKQRADKALQRRQEYKQQQAALREPPSREEFQMLTDLHSAQDEPGFNGLLVDKLTADAWERMYPEQENVPKKIFGGYLIRRAFELPSVCSEQVAPNRAILAAVNRINFFHPVRMGDTLHYTTRVVYTNDSFICVEANIERISRDKTTKALSNSCLFTFVNVDAELNRQPVPVVYPTNYGEDARYLMAHRNCQMVYPTNYGEDVRYLMAHRTTTMTKGEFLKDLSAVHAVLEKRETVAVQGAAAIPKKRAAPAVTLPKAFGKNQVFCMICGKGMKTLARHLKTAHDMTPNEYRKQFGIPRTQPLAAKAYSESRRRMAVDRGLGENLARARAIKTKKAGK